jgi:membrane-associated phospholipid phosphatase
MSQPHPLDAAAEADATAVEKADVALGLQLARFRHHPAVKAAAKAGDLSDQEPLYAVTGLTIAVGLALGDRRLTEAGGRMFAAVVLSAMMKSWVKGAVTRTRPHVLMDGGDYRSDLGGDEKKPRQSFPSGHAAGAAAAACALSRVYPKARRPSLGAAAIMGLIRVAKGAHYPLDVAAGAVVGLAAEAVVHLAARRLSRLFTLRSA